MQGCRAVRVAAGAATGCTLLGIALLVRVVRTSGAAGLDGYISRLGERGVSTAPAYDTALVVAAVALALTGLALTGLALRPRPLVVAVAGILAGAAALLLVSALVPCDRGCPVPLREGWTSVPNLVHFAASGLLFVLTTVAMGLLAEVDAPVVVRCVCRWACRACAVCIMVLCLLMLAFGHGLVNGVVERVLATVTVGWLLVVDVAAVLRRPASAPAVVRHDGRSARPPRRS